MSGIIGSLFDWLLYARIAYWGSHWSANVLIAIPVILIFVKVTLDRKLWNRKLLFFVYVFLDVFWIGTFTPSFHEAIFEPVFVLVRVMQNPASLALYVQEWEQNIEVWRSFDVLFGWTAVVGLLFYWRKMQWRLVDWSPFIFFFGIWIAFFGLEVSLPFPVNVINGVPTYCHDCLVPNLFEFLFNLTYAFAICLTFGVQRLLGPAMRRVMSSLPRTLIRLEQRLGDGEESSRHVHGDTLTSPDAPRTTR